LAGLVAGRRFWNDDDVPFVADDLAARLVALLADAGRKRLTALVPGE
jgi:hypothetical protein